MSPRSIDRFDVGLEVDSYLDNLDHQVEEYWGINIPSDQEDDETRYRLALSKATVALIRAAMQLQQKPGQDIRGLLTIFRADGYELIEDPLVRDFAELEVITELDGMVYEMADRALRLLDYLCNVEGEVAQNYLMRVARSYILGMHPETVVMCGAVLEAALDQWLPTDDKSRTLGVKIRELEGKVIKGRALEAAKEINRLRTDAVHLRIERLPPDAIQVIELLDEVLRSLGKAPVEDKAE